MTMRLVREADIPWVLALARDAYPGRDWQNSDAVAWLKQAISTGSVLFIRDEDAALALAALTFFWARDATEAHVLFATCRRGAIWELLRLFGAALPWLQKNRAAVLRIGADTGVDMRPLAKWIARRGFTWTADMPSYRVALPWAAFSTASLDRPAA